MKLCSWTIRRLQNPTLESSNFEMKLGKCSIMADVYWTCNKSLSRKNIEGKKRERLVIIGMLINIHELLSLASIFTMTGLLSTISSKPESAIVKVHRRASQCCTIVLSKHLLDIDFYKRMPTGQNPVQPTTQATKYYKSLSLLFLLPFLPREKLVQSPDVYRKQQNLRQLTGTM